MSAIISLLLGLVGSGYISERRDWNKGICARTGDRWVHFATDTAGARGYVSRDHVLWVKNPEVDRK